MPCTGEEEKDDMADVAESCVYCRCGCCKDGCPVYEEILEESMSPKGRNELIRAILKGVVDPDEKAVRIAYSCLLCRRDEYSCGAKLKNADATEQLRNYLTSQGIGLLPEHELLAKNLQNYGNPWGEPRKSRNRWAKGQNLTAPKNSGHNDLLFMGCTFALDRSLHKTPVALASITRKAGATFHVMLEGEVCCGSTVRRLGQSELFEKVRGDNVRAILGQDPSRIITPCAGCYKTLSQDYGRMLDSVEVLHSTQYILRLIELGHLKLLQEEVALTYHDPCHLGRHVGIYDEPRKILSSIPGARVVEMKNSRELSRCCGGGGGVKTGYPDISLNIAARRVREAEKTGASLLVSACPFCVQSLSAAAKALESRMVVTELSVLVDNCSVGAGGEN